MINRFTQAVANFEMLTGMTHRGMVNYEAFYKGIMDSYDEIHEALTIAANLEANPYSQAQDEPFHVGEK